MVTIIKIIIKIVAALTLAGAAVTALYHLLTGKSLLKRPVALTEEFTVNQP